MPGRPRQWVRGALPPVPWSAVARIYRGARLRPSRPPLRLERRPRDRSCWPRRGRHAGGRDLARWRHFSRPARGLAFFVLCLLVVARPRDSPGRPTRPGPWAHVLAAAPSCFWLLIYTRAGAPAFRPRRPAGFWPAHVCKCVGQPLLHGRVAWAIAPPPQVVAQHVGRPDCGDALSLQLRGPGGTRYAKHPPTGACLSCSIACFLSAARGRRVLECVGPPFLRAPYRVVDFRPDHVWASRALEDPSCVSFW